MPSRRVEGVAGQIRSLLVLGSTASLTDGQLLERFATGDEPSSSLAFEALVDRHGSMVFRVCRSVLRDPHDAQDAFQATFLVLVKKARAIRDRDSLASWLHGVALRVARHAKGSEARRRRLDRARLVDQTNLTAVDEPDEVGSKLHEEVARLPERYRAPVVLCYLEGQTSEEAARLLGWPVGTVKSRLSRARERLRSRLTRLGLAPASALESRAISPISPRLARETAEAGARFEARSPIEGPASPAMILAKGVLKTMMLSKLKIAMLAVLAAASWAGVSTTFTPGQPIQEPAKVQKPAEQAATVVVPPVKPEPWFALAPQELKATSGSGSALMYALDAKGERIIDFEGYESGLALMYGPDAKGKRIDDLGGKPKTPPKPGFRMILKDLRWVAITGTIDNQLIREALAETKHIPLYYTFVQYKRVEAQYQIQTAEGTWTKWLDVPKEQNWKVIDNLPEVTKERTNGSFLNPALVDPLPWLKKGDWIGVDPEAVLRSTVAGEIHFRSDGLNYKAPLLTVRSIDFTVKSGLTYRYRVRLVFVNPDVGLVDDAPKQLFGPWSEPTAEVRVP